MHDPIVIESPELLALIRSQLAEHNEASNEMIGRGMTEEQYVQTAVYYFMLKMNAGGMPDPHDIILLMTAGALGRDVGTVEERAKIIAAVLK